MRPDNDCTICSSKTTERYCSDVCERGALAIEEILKSVTTLQANDDKKIYFYDHYLSDLMDMCSIELLRMVYAKGPMKQSKYYDRASKLLRAMLKKINRGFISKPLLNNLAELFNRLYCVNAQAWQLRSNWDNTNFTTSERADFASQYLGICCARRDVKKEIDIIFDGEAHREMSF